MSRAILSLILFVAGILHLAMPWLFDPAIPFEFKWIINLSAGILEIFLSLGLFVKKIQDFSARMAALWFLCLIPVHIYVAWNQITIFGIDDLFLLWLRAIIQPGFYFWALSLQTKGWIMAQVWKDVLFLHFEADPKLLQEHLPFKLDLYNDKAILSIVSFTMDGIRFPFLPSVFGLSKLYELNLRTYVEVDGIKGVYFFTLDTGHLPAIGIARFFFSLPYRFSNILILRKKNKYFCESKCPSRAVKFFAEIGPDYSKEDFDLWVTERYGLFTKKSKNTLHGIVEHAPWSLQEIKIKSIKDNFSTQLGADFKSSIFIRPSYCKEIKVRFRPFYKMKDINRLQ